LENVIMKTLKYGRPVVGFVAAAILTFAMGSHAGAQSAPHSRRGRACRLSMAQAVAMALDCQPGLCAPRNSTSMSPRTRSPIAKAAFLPQVQATTEQPLLEVRAAGFHPGHAGHHKQRDFAVRLGAAGDTLARQLVLPDVERTPIDAGGGLSGFNPRLGSTLRVDFTQPLLRDFKTDNLRAGVETAERRARSATSSSRSASSPTEAAVRFAYLNLVGAIEGHKVAQINLDIVQQSLDQSRSRVKVGQSPQIEIIQYEAQVASTRDGLIRAVAQIATAEDNLRTLILDPARPDFWQVHIVPTDTIQLAPREINLEQAIAVAIANRLDLNIERRSLEITDLNIRVNHNNAMPSIDLNASYQSEGTGGTQFSYGSGFPPPILSESRRSYGSALGDTLARRVPDVERRA
jgi:hypothetical protein